MKLNLDERDVYSDYIDELHYRLMIHIPDAIDKDGLSGIIIDLEKGDFLDNIIIWGLEVELGLICKENIEETFTFLEGISIPHPFIRCMISMIKILEVGGNHQKLCLISRLSLIGLITIK